MELVRCGGGGGEERVGGPSKGACEASPSRLENLSHLVAHRRPVRVHLEGEDAVSRYTADLGGPRTAEMQPRCDLDDNVEGELLEEALRHLVLVAKRHE